MVGCSIADNEVVADENGKMEMHGGGGGGGYTMPTDNTDVPPLFRASKIRPMVLNHSKLSEG